jgi:hypothetical protein
MVDYIYGRKDGLTVSNRPHMFIAELYLYIDYLKEQLNENTPGENPAKKEKYINTFCKNLRDGINYYRQLTGLTKAGKKEFLDALDRTELELDSLNYQYEMSVN